MGRVAVSCFTPVLRPAGVGIFPQGINIQVCCTVTLAQLNYAGCRLSFWDIEHLALKVCHDNRADSELSPQHAWARVKQEHRFPIRIGKVGGHKLRDGLVLVPPCQPHSIVSQ